MKKPPNLHCGLLARLQIPLFSSQCEFKHCTGATPRTLIVSVGCWLCDRWFQTFCPPGSKGVQNKALCAYIMASLCQIHKAVSSGRFLRAREIGKAVHQMLQPVVDGPRLPSNALARRKSHLRSKTTAPFSLQFLASAVASHSPGVVRHPTGGKKVRRQSAPLLCKPSGGHCGGPCARVRL